MKPLNEIVPEADYDQFAHRFILIGRNPLTCPHIYVLIGAPASGKSTWTKAHLAAEDARPTVIASTDDQIEAYAAKNGIDYSTAHDKLDMKSLEQSMMGSILAAVAAKQDIIIDRTNLRAKTRNRWMSQLPKNYVRIGVVFVVEPPEVLFERLRHRAASTNKYVPLAVVNDMLKSYQPPTLNEFDIILSGTES